MHCILLLWQQGQERAKLQLTLSLQALKQAGAAGAFSWQVRALSSATSIPHTMLASERYMLLLHTLLSISAF